MNQAARRRFWWFPVTMALGLGLVAGWPGSVGAGTVATGGHHTLVVTTAGELWSWGYCSNGQLGIGQTGGTKTVPTQVTALTGVVAVAAGATHSLALISDGTVWAFGLGTSGQLGQGSNSSSNVPVQVSGLTGIIAIAAGDNHSVALMNDGSVYTWGAGSLGQLGDGGIGNRNTPYLVTGIGPVAAIAAGGSHTLAVLSSVSGSTIKAWGKNANAQLGAGYASSGATSNPLSVNLLSGMASASAGTSYSLAVKSDSTAYGWGLNAQYQIGDNTNTQRLEPVALYDAFSGVSTIVAGQYNSFVIKGDGSLWAHGDNTYGQLATGNTTASHYPIPVPGFTSVAAVGTGPNRHTIIVTMDGEVWAAGYNNNGQLGDGTTANRTSPVKIAEAGFNWKVGTPTFGTAPGLKYAVFNLSLGCATGGATIKYTTDGTDPSPGNGTTYTGAFQVDVSMTVKAMAFKAGLADSNVAVGAYEMKVQTPTFSPGPSTYTTPQSVAIATTTSGAQLFYTTDGSDPTPSSTPYTPGVPVPINTTTTLKARGFKEGWTDSSLKSGNYTMNFGTLTVPVASPAAGTYVSSVEVTLTAQPWAEIRYTTNGATPVATSPLYTGPLTLSATTTIKAKAFHPDYVASAVTTAAYTIEVATPVFDLADGSYPVGTAVTITSETPGATIRFTTDGSDPTSTSPAIASGETLILGNFTLKAKATKAGCTDSGVATAVYGVAGQYSAGSVAAGASFSFVLHPDGTVYAFGWDGSGSMGDGVAGGVTPVPKRINGLSGIVAIASGYGHGLALDHAGRVWSWGLNGDGQVGDNSTYTRPTPAQVAGLVNVVAIGAGGHHSMAVDGLGQFWVWGDDTYGQLGRGSTTTTPVKLPLAHPTLTDVVAMVGGRYFTLVRHGDGSVSAFGQNTSGQVGTGSPGGNVPTPSLALTGAIGIGAGYLHSLAVNADGSGASWGSDYYNQLGDPTAGNMRASAGPIVGLAGLTALAGGEQHTLARTASGAVWSFGANAQGQLGVPGSPGTPLQIQGLSDIISIAAGGYHGLAVSSSGEVWAWGLNSSSQLGDGTTLQRNEPVKVFEAGFQPMAATPSFSPLPGTFTPTESQSVIVSCATPGAVIHYTTNGADPTEGDPVVASGASVVLGQSLTLKARAWKPGWAASSVAGGTYTLEVKNPTVTPFWGSYTTPITVTVSVATTGAEIHFTTSGSEPTLSDPIIASGGTLAVDQTVSLKLKAFKPGWAPSDSVNAPYTLKPATPTFSPGGGPHNSPQDVTIETTSPGVNLHFTTDGTVPTEWDPQVVSGVTVAVDRSLTLKARAFRWGWTPSDVATANYAVNLPPAEAPVISPAGGSFTSEQLTTLESATADATIRYTVDGSEPTWSSPRYSVPLVVDESLTLKARAYAADRAPSATAAASFTVDLGGVAKPTLSKAGGTFATEQTVVITCATPGASIRYSTDGSDPTLATGTAINSGESVSVDRSMVLKVRAFQAGLPNSPMRRADYVITGALAPGGAEAWHYAALGADGRIWTWHDNSKGQLGYTTQGQTSDPAAVPGITTAIDVATGHLHTLALLEDGTVKSFGANDSGQLGNGSTSTAPNYSPVAVSGLTNVTAVAAGYSHSLALRGDGTVVAWGLGSSGQLGNGSFGATPVTTPLQVAGLSDVVAIAAGNHHSLALKADGTVVGFGQNLNGQLGDTSTTNRSTPVAASLPGGITGIAAGAYHSMALKTDGTQQGVLWLFGKNADGQMGNGSTLAYGGQSIPASGLTGVVAMAGGGGHSLAIQEGGLVMAWGRNSSFQLGDGTMEPRLTPVPITNFTDAIQVSGSLFRSHALLENGSAANLSDPDPLLLADQSWMTGDQDGDGLTTWEEHRIGTDPLLRDTNGDGLSDGTAVAMGRDPTSPDVDGDGVWNAAELANGTDPWNRDTDGDGHLDGADTYPLDPTRWEVGPPDPHDHTPPDITLDEPPSATLSATEP